MADGISPAQIYLSRIVGVVVMARTLELLVN